MGSGFQATEMWRDMVRILHDQVLFNPFSTREKLSFRWLWKIDDTCSNHTTAFSQEQMQSMFYSGKFLKIFIFFREEKFSNLKSHKQIRPDLFTDNTTRENIVRLCQRFLESRVFFPAKAWFLLCSFLLLLSKCNQKQHDLQQRFEQLKFEDSNTSFYRFNTDGTYLGEKPPFLDYRL